MSVRVGTKDKQQAAMYKAEESVTGGMRFKTHKEVERFVGLVTETLWWKRRFPHIERVVVVQGEDKEWSWCEWYPPLAVLTIGPPHHRVELILYHELAHAGASRATGHGPVFAKTYLEICKRFNPDLAIQLRDAFHEHKVRVAE